MDIGLQKVFHVHVADVQLSLMSQRVLWSNFRGKREKMRLIVVAIAFSTKHKLWENGGNDQSSSQNSSKMYNSNRVYDSTTHSFNVDETHAG